jgi:simple sugar transport system substrate-binding protein
MGVMEAYLAENIGLAPSDIDTGKGLILQEDVAELRDLAAQGLR